MPHSWSSTAIILAYDDSDGWYDHLVLVARQNRRQFGRPIGRAHYQLFNFTGGGTTPSVILDASTGNLAATINTGGGSTSTTKAVANPKNTFATLVSATLDATGSTSYNGGPLTYQWTNASSGLQANCRRQYSRPDSVLPKWPRNLQLRAHGTDAAGTTSLDTVSVTKP